MRRPIDAWVPWGVGIGHAAGPQPLRSAEDDEPDYVPPPNRVMPFAFGLALPEPDETDEPDPLLWEGD